MSRAFHPAAAWLALVVALPCVAYADRDGLADLRAEVERLADQLEVERTASRDELASLRAERAELERQTRAARTRVEALQRIRAEADAQAEAVADTAQRWAAPLRAALDLVRAHVERGLPFAPAQRIAALEQLERDLEAARPDYGRVLDRLLRMLEEERAMGGEVAIARQRMAIEGKPQLVRVLRLGMALMYVQTPDGRVGWARPRDDAPEGRTEPGPWTLELIDHPALREALTQRFDQAQSTRPFGAAPLVLPTEGAFAGADR